MIHYITAIFLAFMVAKTVCATSCPLGTLHEGQIENMSKINGTWSEYQKTAQFLNNQTCFTYEVNCLNETACHVDLIQNKTKIETNEVTKNVTDIKWGNESVYINVDDDNQYAFLWNCEENEKGIYYQLDVLVRNLSDETITKKIHDIITKLNVTYKSELKIIDYEACNDATMLRISIAVIFVAILSLFL